MLQPGYLPRLGFFDQVSRSDLFVYYDSAQFDKNGWRNRNRIKGENGEPLWLTVPVRQRLGTPIRDVAIDNRTPWARRHVRSLRQHYHRAPFADDDETNGHMIAKLIAIVLALCPGPGWAACSVQGKARVDAPSLIDATGKIIPSQHGISPFVVQAADGSVAPSRQSTSHPRAMESLPTHLSFAHRGAGTPAPISIAGTFQSEPSIQGVQGNDRAKYPLKGDADCGGER